MPCPSPLLQVTLFNLMHAGPVRAVWPELHVALSSRKQHDASAPSTLTFGPARGLKQPLPLVVSTHCIMHLDPETFCLPPTLLRCAALLTCLQDGSILVGAAAVAAGATSPLDTIYSAKRIIGRQYSEVQGFSDQLVYSVQQAQGGAAVLQCSALNRLLKPEEVSAEVLRHLLNVAQRQLDDDVAEAVVTVPAHFGAEQRAATLRAAQAAGLQRVSLLQGGWLC